MHFKKLKEDELFKIVIRNLYSMINSKAIAKE